MAELQIFKVVKTLLYPEFPFPKSLEATSLILKIRHNLIQPPIPAEVSSENRVAT